MYGSTFTMYEVYLHDLDKLAVAPVQDTVAMGTVPTVLCVRYFTAPDVCLIFLLVNTPCKNKPYTCPTVSSTLIGLPFYKLVYLKLTPTMSLENNCLEYKGQKIGPQGMYFVYRFNMLFRSATSKCYMLKLILSSFSAIWQHTSQKRPYSGRREV